MWKLPNPFINAQNEEVRNPADWESQRAYLRRVLTEDFYGEMPPAPDNLKAEKVFEKTVFDGEGRFEVFDLSFGPGEMVHVKTAWITPSRKKEERPVPIVMCGGFVNEEIAQFVISEGFALAVPLFDEAAPDTKDYQEGTLYKAYPTYSFKVIVMWGFLMSRVIDWVKTLDCVDPERLVIAGHSRYGKAALSCAVYDERVSVCLAAGSGCGGMGSLRVWGSRFGEGTGAVETLGSMVRDNFPHWFKESLADYGAQEPSGHYRENELRFDANFIGSVIAPRPLMILEGLDDTWANPYGTMASFGAVSEVYHFLGADEKLAIHFREGGHAFNLEDWRAAIDFTKVQLFGEEKKIFWYTRQESDPVIARDFRAPSDTEEAPKGTATGFTKEQIEGLKKMLTGRWAFGEAGLETGMEKFIKSLLLKAESEGKE